MIDKSVIYVAWCLCHAEDGIRYVGQTSKGMNSRATVHLWHAKTETSKSHNSRMSKWIRKHGAENVVFSLLEVCTRAELNEREKSWIALFRSLNYRLINILEGGDQPRGHKRPEHSQRMSGSGNPMYGADRKELMDRIRVTGPLPESTRMKMSESHVGEQNSHAKLTADDVRYIRSRPIKYGTKTQLAREFGVTPQNILSIIRRESWKHIE